MEEADGSGCLSFNNSAPLGWAVEGGGLLAGFSCAQKACSAPLKTQHHRGSEL